jgi:myo-inositol-1(or 4)-monophosphatase
MPEAPADPSALLDLAVEMAREAGAMVKARRDAVTRMEVAATKSTPTDVVTESDTAAEELIRAVLAQRRPDDGVLGEESAETTGTSGVIWVVDPIDGTVNYLYGIPHYAVSIGARIGDEVVAGVVHNPVSGETFTAVRGAGAFLDGRPLHVSPVTTLDATLVGTGFGYDAARRATQARVLLEVLPAVRDVRRFGVASLDLCAVAAGRIDAYYERGLKPWDLAAGGLIAEEAGAVVTGLRGASAGESMVVAAPPAVLGALVALLETLNADAG